MKEEKNIDKLALADTVSTTLLGILMMKGIPPGEEAAKILGEVMAVLMLGLEKGAYAVKFLESFNHTIKEIIEKNEKIVIDNENRD